MDADDKMKQIDPLTGKKCVQSVVGNNRDDHRIENNPGMFAAEQTWPTEEEMKRPRKGSLNHDEMTELESEQLDVAKIKPAIKDDGKQLAGLFDRMQIEVVGREHGKNDSGDSDFEDVESDGSQEDDDDGLAKEDQNLIS